MQSKPCFASKESGLELTLRHDLILPRPHAFYSRLETLEFHPVDVANPIRGVFLLICRKYPI